MQAWINIKSKHTIFTFVLKSPYWQPCWHGIFKWKEAAWPTGQVVSTPDMKSRGHQQVKTYLLGKRISISFVPCMMKAVLSRDFTLPSFLKTNECFFPLKSMQYPSIKSAISSALASEKVVNTRGCKENHEIKHM